MGRGLLPNLRWCDQAGAVDLSEILDVEESFADALGTSADACSLGTKFVLKP